VPGADPAWEMSFNLTPSTRCRAAVDAVDASRSSRRRRSVQGCVYEMSRDAYEALWRSERCGNQSSSVASMAWSRGHSSPSTGVSGMLCFRPRPLTGSEGGAMKKTPYQEVVVSVRDASGRDVDAITCQVCARRGRRCLRRVAAMACWWGDVAAMACWWGRRRGDGVLVGGRRGDGVLVG
jgi:hypothetical protein